MSKEGLLPTVLEQAYLSSLRRLQNSDGGWGFRPGCRSRVEPTAWALIALEEFVSPVISDENADRGISFLVGTQLEDGSWIAAPGQRKGCWVTSLACWALRSRKQYAASLQKGLHWLNEDKPRDAGFWWKLIRKLVDRKRVSTQNPSLSGWSWTPHTASWVEPTCYALIAQQVVTATPHPDSVKRFELAKAMLYDRMCPGGGWNCGNPRVYGVAGQPQVGPTVWALIALREHSQRPENRESLAWLERNREKIQSPESLALANIALKVYGRENNIMSDAAEATLASSTWNVTTLCWSALALSDKARWLNAITERSL